MLRLDCESIIALHMGFMDAKDIRSRLALLSKRDAARRVFGASSHEYERQPPLTEAEVAAAESQWGVRFPDDYRGFLVDIGGGGAGPLYGIFPLKRVDGVWRWEGDGADLVSSPSDPFPHATAWTPCFREREDDEDEDAYWRERDAWDEAVYWNPQQTHGAICICHEGCAIRDWLVLTGPERGHIWLDDRANYGGLRPRELAGSRVTFGAWYLDWLATAERDVEGRGRR